jgi:hypothetical protein
MSQINAHVFENVCVTKWNLENGWESWVGSCLRNLTQGLRMQWTDEQKQNHVTMYGLYERLGYPQVMCFFFVTQFGGDCEKFKINHRLHLPRSKHRTCPNASNNSTITGLNVSNCNGYSLKGTSRNGR